MLCVRIDGRDMETTPASLARLVFDGRADRHSPSRIPGGIAEQSLEYSLGAIDCEALTDELHRRLLMMYAAEASAVDVPQLCEQVEHLCRWHWAYPHIAARFFWTAAWLNELLGHLESAVDFYDAFHQAPCRESHLRLLAYNNRGVLRIRLGRLDGIQDLAQAAIAEGGPGTAEHGRKGVVATPSLSPVLLSRVPIGDRPPQPGGLPTACFNLLNLINVSFGAADLLRMADEELAEFFSHLPPDVAASWLGGPCGGESRDLPGGQPDRSPRPGVNGQLSILRDPTFRRVNALTTGLAAQARGLAAESHQPAGRVSFTFGPLRLWDCRLSGGGLEEDSAGPEDGRYHYAEAASLLLSDDIPSLLMRVETPLTRAEQSAREELAMIESRLAADQYDLAKSRLQVQRRILSSLNRRGRLAGLLARVDAQIERITHLEAQKEQLELQRTCARLVSEVEAFCTRADPGRAERDSHDLRRRLQQFRAQLPAQAGGEVTGLLDGLAARMQQHLQGLRRAEIRDKTGDLLQHVRETRLGDWTSPVPESAYRALAQCQVHDPEGWIEDWAALREQLDAHQGQYHLHRALSALQSNPVSRDRVADDLAAALVCSPEAWLTIAPLFGLGSHSGVGISDVGVREAHDAQGTPKATPGVREPHPPSAIEEAGRLFERVLPQIGGNAGKCLRLWQCVETTLRPVLAGGDGEAISRAQALAERCLDHWPAGLPQMPGRADPRHPVHRLLESCAKARRLLEAEQWLHARPPCRKEAETHFADLLRLGLDTRDQLKRVVTGLYLSQFHDQDALPVQRQVLAGLDAWVEALPGEGNGPMGEQDVARETQRVRTMVSAGQSAAIPPQTRPAGPVDAVGRALPAGGSEDGGDTREKDENDQGRKGA
jgi:hypothetical protein